MKRYKKKLFLLAISIVVGYLLRFSNIPLSLNTLTISSTPPPITTINQPHATSSARVKFVVDGDTIELENGQRVRYIGIDTPELHHPLKPVQCFGKEAKDENEKLVKGKEITLKKDISETDRYGRLLRYIYVPTDASPEGMFLNEYLVKEGFAHMATFPPDVEYASIFRKAQNEAIINEKGLWKNCR
ncbi:MAG: thermonuclease family protein [bacterium]|nr:thermonuclease family protein [bacterium]